MAEKNESYYKTIDGKKYKRALLEAAEAATKGAGDGRISKGDAEKLFLLVKDGDTYTDTEKDTVRYIREKFKWTEAADEWFRTEVRKWGAEKGHKGDKKDEVKKTDAPATDAPKADSGASA